MEGKTIAQQMEQIVEDVCRNYCKWPEKWDDSMEDCELSESSICQNCPLNKLV